ncbi:MAG TPA: glutaredoxin domain-containing protein [Candidatus Nanoarchaeia archaeon]|nr:glutaredoxin domain-containing protein [Candidatus Nanoarchaeia archaeon]
MMKKLILFVLASLLLVSFASAENNVTIYFFYGDGCPHCAKAEPFLDKLEAKYTELTVESFETWHNKTNADLFVDMSAACGSKVVGVPTVFIGHKPIVGFTTEEETGKEIEGEVVKCIREGCVDLMERIGQNETSCPAEKPDSIITLPVFGELDVTKISLPALTIIIGLLDGFNPCAMWVLLFLLALLVYTKSRKRMIIIGGTFILVSGIVYYIFMAAWLNFFLLIGYLPFLRAIVGGAAVIFGLINIKDMFWFKKGVSLSISDAAKPKLFERMRKIVHESALPIALLSVTILAFTVNTIELLCTAGFPAIYTKILTMNDLSTFAYYGYLFLYILMYMLDDFLVFIIAVVTLSSKKLTEQQGKWMKFIAGVMMLGLGLLLIFKPELLMFR